MATQPTELQLGDDHHPATMQDNVDELTSTQSREIPENVQLNQSLVPGSRMIASEAQFTRKMLRREDLLESFEPIKRARLDRTHRRSAPPALGGVLDPAQWAPSIGP